MNRTQFWKQIQQFIQATYPAELGQYLWEQQVKQISDPTLPTELILRTVCSGAVYLPDRVPLHLPLASSEIPFSPRQREALELGLSNNPLAVITGLPGSGKTLIAGAIAQTAINHGKRVLLLTQHEAALAQFAQLPGYPFRLSSERPYDEWLRSQLRHQLAQPQMDYLPLHLLPDSVLAKLRTRAGLETWLPLVSTISLPDLAQRLQDEFPDLEFARIQLLAHRLQQLAPLLEQQLQLSQLYGALSAQGVTDLTRHFDQSALVPVVGTRAELLNSRLLWDRPFDLVIVEEAEGLNWAELLLVAGLGRKLLLCGSSLWFRQPPLRMEHPSFLERFAQGFHWLSQAVLPAYHCDLPVQFRLHPEIATPVYGTLCDRWVQTHTTQASTYLPSLSGQVIWQDVPGLPTNPPENYQNPLEGQRLWEFLQSLEVADLSQVGIVTFYAAQRDWLEAHRPPVLAGVKIGLPADWAGQERAIVLISCVGNSTYVSAEQISIAITRGRDYLIIFGNEDYWWQSRTLMRSLLARRDVQIERKAVLA